MIKSERFPEDTHVIRSLHDTVSSRPIRHRKTQGVARYRIVLHDLLKLCKRANQTKFLLLPVSRLTKFYHKIFLQNSRLRDGHWLCNSTKFLFYSLYSEWNPRRGPKTSFNVLTPS